MRNNVINLDDYRDRKPVPGSVNPWPLIFIGCFVIWAGVFTAAWAVTR